MVEEKEKITKAEVKDISNKVFNTEFFTTKEILNNIRKRSRQEPKTSKFNNLYNLLYKEDFIFQALQKIQKNKGASTPGVDKENLDRFNKQDIKSIIFDLKNKKFRFQPVNRIYIPKPGKKTKRPLGIPTFRDRIVQEMIRSILESIYEPVFEDLDQNTNFGFRPNKSTHDAMDVLDKKAKGTEWAIEGDIEKAYDTVNHKKLMEILKEKIEDKKFLRLIYQGLKAGILEKGKYEHSLIGTPQGGIASPILFNIYMRKFDEFINTEIKKYFDERNTNEKRKYIKKTTEYSTVAQRVYRARKKLGEIIKKHRNLAFKFWPESEFKEYEKTRKDLKIAHRRQISIKVEDPSKKTLRFVFVRYADDWIFVTNLNKESTIEIKNRIQEFLLNELKLNLSLEKTKITHLKNDTAKFLGFRFSYFCKGTKFTTAAGEKKETKKHNKMSVIRRYRTPQKVREHIKRTTGWRLKFGIDKERILNRLISNNFMNKKTRRGIRKPPWVVLNMQTIIDKYNYMIRGITTYYAPIVGRGELNEIIYILTYSCYHTLANKFRISIRKLIKKHGKKMKTKIINKETGKIIKTRELIDYISLYNKIEDKYNKEKVNELCKDQDPLQIRNINWRTPYKMDRYCVICGSDKQVESHHVRHVRKGNVIGFTKIMSNLNRKTIMCCKVCHQKIHKGLYDGISLSDLYDPEFAIL